MSVEASRELAGQSRSPLIPKPTAAPDSLIHWSLMNTVEWCRSTRRGDGDSLPGGERCAGPRRVAVRIWSARQPKSTMLNCPHKPDWLDSGGEWLELFNASMTTSSRGCLLAHPSTDPPASTGRCRRPIGMSRRPSVGPGGEAPRSILD
jgi:hypothetical protein